MSALRPLGRSRRRRARPMGKQTRLAPSRPRPRPRPVAGAASSQRRKYGVGFTGYPVPLHRTLQATSKPAIFAPISQENSAVPMLFPYQGDLPYRPKHPTRRAHELYMTQAPHHPRTHARACARVWAMIRIPVILRYERAQSQRAGRMLLLWEYSSERRAA